MEIHVDLLNADTNQWIAGDAVKVRNSIDSDAKLVMSFDRPIQKLIHTCFVSPQPTPTHLQVTGSSGKVTTRVFVPADAPQNVKWNAYIAPQGEQWPNMIAQTSFDTPIGEKVANPCPPLRNSARAPKAEPDFNYVLVRTSAGLSGVLALLFFRVCVLCFWVESSVN